MNECAASLVQPRPLEELKEVALGIARGTLYTSLELEDPDHAVMVFLPFALMDDDEFEALQEVAGLFYVEREHASPCMGWNDLPFFFCVEVLTKDDARLVLALVERLQAGDNQILESIASLAAEIGHPGDVAAGGAKAASDRGSNVQAGAGPDLPADSALGQSSAR